MNVGRHAGQANIFAIINCKLGLILDFISLFLLLDYTGNQLIL